MSLIPIPFLRRAAVARESGRAAPDPMLADKLAGRTSPLGAELIKQATLLFLVIGFVLRAARYLLDFPFWGDETMFAVNFLDRGYLDLAKPLDNLQISPILFSWIELTATKLLGFSTQSLRLFPFLCGLASLFLFWRLALHVCRGIAIPVAVGIFSVGYYVVRHSVEIKPYSSDLCAGLLLLLLAVKIEKSRAKRWWVTLIAVTPAVVLLSYPVVFVAGGVSLYLLATATDRRQKSFWLPWGLYNLALVATFLGNYWIIASAHYARTYTQGVGAMWVEGWPPITQPWEFVPWAVREHTGRMFSHPVGGKNGGSVATFLLFAMGTWRVWRRNRQRGLLVLLLSPFLLGFIAAALQRYPYGGSARTMLYVAPAICLLAGIGGGWLIERIAGEARRRRNALVVLALLCAFAGVSLVRDLVQPYKTTEDKHMDDFAQWFWTDYAHGCELVCVGSDLGQNFYGPRWNEAAHDYICLQQIYSARHREGQGPNWETVSREHPLKIVSFHVKQADVNADLLELWLAEMRRTYELIEHEVLQINPHQDITWARTYEVYTFVPRVDEPLQVADTTPAANE